MATRNFEISLNSSIHCVPRMGVEPMISTLRRLRPRPLDERGVYLIQN